MFDTMKFREDSVNLEIIYNEYKNINNNQMLIHLKIWLVNEKSHWSNIGNNDNDVSLDNIWFINLLFCFHFVGCPTARLTGVAMFVVTDIQLITLLQSC